jgi:lipopolysaccharide/colanic/teichoic acid biosynthesis glycosyltransferase
MSKEGKFSWKLVFNYTLYFVVLYILLGVLKIKSDHRVALDLRFIYTLLLMGGVWVVSGMLFKKYNLRSHKLREYGFYSIFSSAILSFFLLKIVKYFIPEFIYGKTFFAVLILTATLGEVILLMIQYYMKSAKEIEIAQTYINTERHTSKRFEHEAKPLDNKVVELIQSAIIDAIGKRALNWIGRQVDLLSSTTVVHNTVSEYNVRLIINQELESFVNLRKINDHRFLNKFFESVNDKLPDGGLYVGVAETLNTRYSKIIRKKSFIRLIHLYWDFVVHRVAPKIPVIQKIYFPLTDGRNRALSKAEILGRLYSCGFEVVSYTTIAGHFLFCVRKIKEPSYDMMPTYGPFIALRRVGKKGEILRVYKFRTMYPYSEYLQKYLVEQNGYDEVGKIKNDFRVTNWGAWLRKVWLDELPQLLNVLKGQLAIVGVRPLSLTKFNELPEDLQKERIKYKPGCVPPYVALCLPDEDGNVKAERIYLRNKKQHRFVTDIVYLWKAVYNILSGKIRSA